jgi:hypothetical protein
MPALGSTPAAGKALARRSSRPDALDRLGGPVVQTAPESPGRLPGPCSATRVVGIEGLRMLLCAGARGRMLFCVFAWAPALSPAWQRRGEALRLLTRGRRPTHTHSRTHRARSCDASYTAHISHLSSIVIYRHRATPYALMQPSPAGPRRVAGRAPRPAL